MQYRGVEDDIWMGARPICWRLLVFTCIFCKFQIFGGAQGDSSNFQQADDISEKTFMEYKLFSRNGELSGTRLLFRSFPL